MLHISSLTTYACTDTLIFETNQVLVFMLLFNNVYNVTYLVAYLPKFPLLILLSNIATI